ncbi:MAG: glycosyltransferase family 4 protein [Candidatus Pacebacteria bacterium]|nr:glycosyltransferase family 4 protein [Candidatus Paceibacterota bacterium]
MADKVKILFVTNDLGVGGVQRLAVEFANFLDKSKFDVSLAILFSRKDSYFYKDLLGTDIKFFNFDFNNYWDLPEFFKFYKFLRKNKFDIVFTQLFMADFIGRIAAFFAGVPVIVTEIQNLVAGLPQRYILTDKLLGKITDLCISTTNAITEYAIKIIGFPPEKVAEVPTNAVDARRFEKKINKADFKKSLGVPPDAKMVITIGRMVGQKGHTILLKAAPKILAKNPNVYFVIVGSGRLEGELKAEAESLKLGEKVKFPGARTDTPDLLMASDVFAFPSLWEGQGLILFEAMFAGTPIVASNVGGIPDVIKHEETGLLAEPGNPDDLAEKILRALDDKKIVEKITKTAFERYKDRTMENSAKKLEDAFLRVYNSKRN